MSPRSTVARMLIAVYTTAQCATSSRTTTDLFHFNKGGGIADGVYIMADIGELFVLIYFSVTMYDEYGHCCEVFY